MREAVNSCYVQGLAYDEFEVVMVDDGSTDGTADLMRAIATEHSNIKLVFHPENRGGGAARNTGINTSINTIIYCLDSDNFFAPNSVKPMLNYLSETGADGIAFYERRFFVNANPHKFTPRYNKILERSVVLNDLFSENSIMLDNFFFTKTSFLTTNKYPEHHGFDTQTFEIDYLAKKNKVMVCPNSIFYHRQNQDGHKSYYEREYERGLISINTYLSLEPIIQTLHSDAIELIINFDVFQKNFHGTDANLQETLHTYVRSGKPLQKESVGQVPPLTTVFIEMCAAIAHNDYDKALRYLGHCIKEAKKQTPLLLYMYLRISYGIMGLAPIEINEATAIYLQKNNLLNQPKYKRVPQILKPLHSIYLKIFK